MVTINPKEVSVPKFHAYMLGTVGPRPIAFASTINKAGDPNLAPFSFFNAFSSNPPILIFSPSRRVRDNTIKHTLENIYETKEVVINIVTFDMVQQTNLASTEYPKGVNEFVKAGFEQIKSEKVKPYRVKESPVQYECKVNQVIELGAEGGAGNLVVCEVLLIHLSEEILDKEGKIDQHKLGLVGRLGGNFYAHVNGDAIFEVEKPLATTGIGIDQIPEKINNSKVLTGNNLGLLGNVWNIPNDSDIAEFKQNEAIQKILARTANDKDSIERHLHTYAKELIEMGQVDDAWKVLMISLKQ